MPEETAALEAREYPRGEAGTLARTSSARRPLLGQVVGFGPEEVQTLRRMLSAVLHLTSLAFDEATGCLSVRDTMPKAFVLQPIGSAAPSLTQRPLPRIPRGGEVNQRARARVDPSPCTRIVSHCV